MLPHFPQDMPLQRSSRPLTILTLTLFPPNIPPTLPSHWPNTQRHLPSLPSCSTLTTPTLSSLPLTILILPRSPQDEPPMPVPHLWAHPSAPYHLYASVLDP
ncbi:hypothetical protein O181_040251 [Austropuccinia psidii MF-1]|uniref:Uncharacterized protein n=1 Tax=Austropuccinia psidii MF-1 TaxID=1389203 RepID=A0A9Q3DB14_9BASI|nr:hypothetical protein [Austropuccinia psidii MF-1]